MTFPVYTAIAGALLLILQLALMINTGLHRVASGINIGAGEDRDLERKIRRHGNLAENAALFIIVFALIELLTGQSAIVLALTTVFVIVRVSHALSFSSLAGSHGLDAGPRIYPAMRAIGGLGTFLCGVVAGSYLIYVIVTAT